MSARFVWLLCCVFCVDDRTSFASRARLHIFIVNGGRFSYAIAYLVSPKSIVRKRGGNAVFPLDSRAIVVDSPVACSRKRENVALEATTNSCCLAFSVVLGMEGSTLRPPQLMFLRVGRQLGHRLSVVQLSKSTSMQLECR